MSERASNRMGRPRREDRESVAETTLTIRLTMAEKDGLERLVAKRQAVLQREYGLGVTLSMAGYIRSIIAREVEANGLAQAERPAIQTPERPAVQTPVIEPPSPEERRLEVEGYRKHVRDLVLDAVRRVADPKSGLASVPVVVKAVLDNSPCTMADVHATMLELGEGDGPLELRPESGVTSKTRADASLCPRGAKGVVLSMVCERRHAVPKADRAESIRARLVRAIAARATAPAALGDAIGKSRSYVQMFKTGGKASDEALDGIDAELRKVSY